MSAILVFVGVVLLIYHRRITPDDSLRNFVVAHEGFSSKVYILYGKEHVGYGFLISANPGLKNYLSPDGSISVANANVYLDKLLRDLRQQVVDDSLLNGIINLRSYQIDALVSFIYNVGWGNWKNSELRKYLYSKPCFLCDNPYNMDIVKELFLNWSQPNLGYRRQAEFELFANGYTS